MKQLKFSNPTFHEGENITVRRGTQWSGVSGIIPINDRWNAEILYTSSFSFFDLLNSDLEKEHDESCRTYNGLLKEMIRLYPDFDEREIVTIVHFVPLLNQVLNAPVSDTTGVQSSNAAD